MATKWQVGTLSFELLSGRIEALPERVGVIVSPDDSFLSHGGGASAALWRVAEDEEGLELTEYVRSEVGLGPYTLETILLTPAFKLKADHLLHAITIDFDTNRTIAQADVAQLYGRLLDASAELDAGSIALPLLGAGRGALGVEPSAVALWQAVSLRAAVDSSLKHVLLVVLPENAAVVAQVLGQRVHEREPMGLLLGQLTSASKVSRAVAKLSSIWLQLTRDADRNPGAVEFMLARMFDCATSSLVTAATLTKTASVDASHGYRTAALLSIWDKLESKSSKKTAKTKNLRIELLKLIQFAAQARKSLAHENAGRTDFLEKTLAVLAASEAIVGLLSRLAGVSGGASCGETLAVGVPWKLLSPNARREYGKMAPALVAAPDGAISQLKETPVSKVREALGPRENKHPPAAVGASAVQLNFPALLSATREPQHVRKLCDILRSQLTKDQSAEFNQRLEQQGYAGEPDLRLLEYCIRTDPIEILDEHFTISNLRDLLHQRTGTLVPEHLTPREVRIEFLRSLGFPVPVPVTGLSGTLSAVCDLQTRLWQMNIAAVRGAVAEVSGKIEKCLQVLLRFLCKTAFRKPPELFFLEHKQLEKGFELSRCGLGKLLDLLGFVSTQLKKDKTEFLKLFQRDFTLRQLEPKNLKLLAPLRNKLTHYDRDFDRAPEKEAKKLAKEFLDESRKFLEYLGQPENRVFPYEVRVTCVTTDSWGRRTVNAENEEGRTEVIFTDELLRPGEVYYMHPRTNPLRVDPYLVEAGDLFTKPPKPKKNGV